MRRGWSGFALALVAVTAAAGTARATSVEQPRAFGHVLGDVLTQRVLLQHEGRDVTPATLPAADRVGLWLERREPRIESDAEGRRWLAIDYQLINAARTLTMISLPALSIATDAGATLALPAWPLSVGPLTPPEVFAQGAMQPMRPDRPVAALPTTAIEQQLRLALAALASVLLAWLGWWTTRQWREARRLPFAHASRELRRLDPANPDAWLALHHAVNATAGHVVQTSTLPRLFAAAPHLRPLQPRIEAFYRRSNERFFASEPASYPLLELCRALRDAERHHQR